MSFESPSLLQIPSTMQTQLQEWEMRPLQMVKGIEVKEHMREVKGGRKRSMSASYKAIRKDIMTLPPGVVVVAYLGRSSSGKSHDAQADNKLFRSDEFLHAWSEEAGVPVAVESWPFAYGLEAAKTAQAHRDFPQWAIPSDIKHGQYTAEQYARQSGLQGHIIETQVLAPEDTPRTRVLQLESSCPTAAPIVERGQLVGMKGIDRGLRVIFDLALRPETRERMHIFAFERHPVVAEEAAEFRHSLNDEATPDNEVFWRENDFSYDDLNESDPNEVEKPIKLMQQGSQELARGFLQKGMAPPGAQERSDRELDELKEQISKEEGMNLETDRGFYAYIQALLGMSDERFHVITSQHFLGEKGFDLHYFIHSLPVKLFTEIRRSHKKK